MFCVLFNAFDYTLPDRLLSSTVYRIDIFLKIFESLFKEAGDMERERGITHNKAPPVYHIYCGNNPFAVPSNLMPIVLNINK